MEKLRFASIDHFENQKPSDANNKVHSLCVEADGGNRQEDSVE